MSMKSVVKTKPSVFGKLTLWALLAVTLVVGGMLISQQPSKAEEIVVYKSPTCGCCKNWVKHLEENGYSVKVHNRNDMNPIKAEMGVPRRLQSCHTAKVGGYVVEGHVPADVIDRLLKEKPDIKGLSVPGMVVGSPGMEGPRKDPYNIVTFGENGKITLYESR